MKFYLLHSISFSSLSSFLKSELSLKQVPGRIKAFFFFLSFSPFGVLWPEVVPAIFTKNVWYVLHSLLMVIPHCYFGEGVFRTKTSEVMLHLLIPSDDSEWGRNLDVSHWTATTVGPLIWNRKKPKVSQKKCLFPFGCVQKPPKGGIQEANQMPKWLNWLPLTKRRSGPTPSRCPSS